MSVSTQQALLEPGFVLHTRAYRNTSLLLEVLARDRGRIGLIVRGARSKRSRVAGLLQPFQPLALSWQIRGELGALREVEPAGRPFQLRGRRLVSGFYANELLLRLLGRDDPHTGLFEVYFTLLDGLGSERGEAAVVRAFERDLLAILGYGLPLARDTQDDALVPEQWYRYDPGLGATPVANAHRQGLVVSGETLLGLAKDPISDAVARASRDLMRSALKPHLGQRPLKSRELYSRYQHKGEARDGASSGQS